MSKRSRENQQPNGAIMLLGEVAAFPPSGRVLIYGGALATALAERARGCDVRIADTSSLALEQARLAFHDQCDIAAEAALSPERYGGFDMALIDGPQSRSLARRWLVEAHAALKPGGTLLIAGANDMGIRSLIDDASALFGGAQTLLAKRHARVARALRGADMPLPAWTREAGVAPGSWFSFALALTNETVTLESLPGVFSYERLDAGTRLLLEHVGDLDGARVLDLGCGYGVIGIVAARRGAAQVDMLDENVYAVLASQRNAARYNMANVRVAAANVRAPAFRGPYDLVVSNPPFHRGKTVDYTVAQAFIDYAQEVLTPGGRLLLVANSFIRYDTVLREQFREVERLAGTPSFTVWQACGVRAR